MGKFVVALSFLLLSTPVLAQGGQKERAPFDLKALRSLGWEIESRAPVAGIEPAVQAVVMTIALPEGQGVGLGRVSRLFLLDATDHVVFDSFAFDKVSDSIEPSVNSRTFFGLKWSVTRGTRGRPAYLVLSGTMPLQAPGEPVRTCQRTAVLSQVAGDGFVEVVDVRGPRPAITGPGEVRVLY